VISDRLFAQILSSQPAPRPWVAVLTRY